MSFDNINHNRLIELLSLRIADRSLLRLIKKWLKAGVLDTDGKVIHPETGSPQGGIISPILANVYLHYCLDKWFREEVKANCRGKACLFRYADDFVCAFQTEEDAQTFYEALERRLEEYGLQLAADKTRVFHFSRTQEPGTARFDFLGFEFYWGRDRKDRPNLKRRTSRKKLRNSLANLTQWCKKNRNIRLRMFFQRLSPKLRGYYNYYGVVGNARGLSEFYTQATRILFKWLNRRSQRRSYTWPGFNRMLVHFQVPRPRVRPKPRIEKPAAIQLALW